MFLTKPNFVLLFIKPVLVKLKCLSYKGKKGFNYPGFNFPAPAALTFCHREHSIEEDTGIFLFLPVAFIF